MHKLGYHAKYFTAIAYWELAQVKFNSAGDNGKGMGEAVAYLKIANS
jgi:hypothetical protein